MYRSIFFPEHRYKVTSYLKGILKVIVILVDIKNKKSSSCISEKGKLVNHGDKEYRFQKLVSSAICHLSNLLVL